MERMKDKGQTEQSSYFGKKEEETGVGGWELQREMYCFFLFLPFFNGTLHR